MKTVEKPPGLISDLGSVAGLYGTVFWMLTKRLQYGRDWEERLANQALKPYQRRDDSGVFGGQPHAN